MDEIKPTEIPKAGCQAFLFLHQEYTHFRGDFSPTEPPREMSYKSFPSGKHDLQFSWRFRVDGVNGIGRAASVLRIDVLPTTARNFSALRQRLEKRWQEAGKIAEQQDLLIDTLYDAPHRELIDTALSFLRSPQLSPDAHGRFLVLNSWRQAPELTHATFAELADKSKSTVAVDIFEIWREKPLLLPDAEFGKLCQSNRLWSRILTYAVFGHRRDRNWVAGLRQKVSGLCSSASTQKVAAIVRDLDDNRFRIRRRALDDLFDLGETAETQVRATLKQTLSAEVRSKLVMYLEHIEDGDGRFLGKRAVELLKNTATVNGKEMLELLAQGDPDNFVTRQAKQALQNRNQPK